MATTRILVSLALLAAPLAGLPAQERHGWYAGIGLGWGSAGASCGRVIGFGNCGSASREGAATGTLKAGVTLSSQLQLGLEATGWTRKESGVRETLGHFSVMTYWYPSATHGWFLQSGIGESIYQAEISLLGAPPGSPDSVLAVASETLKGTGWGLTVGLGYDLRLSDDVSITPVLRWHWGNVGDLELRGTRLVTGWKQNMIDAGVGITFH
jgi:hypothetical protein